MSTTSRPARRSAWFDLAAIGASAACLVHCLLLPLVFAATPAASLLIDVPESFHIGAFLVAVPASAVAMMGGYRHHGAIHPIGMAVAGLLLIGIGALAGLRLAFETGLTVIGSVTLALAHMSNWRLRKLAIAGANHQQ